MIKNARRRAGRRGFAVLCPLASGQPTVCCASQMAALLKNPIKKPFEPLPLLGGAQRVNTGSAPDRALNGGVNRL